MARVFHRISRAPRVSFFVRARVESVIKNTNSKHSHVYACEEASCPVVLRSVKPGNQYRRSGFVFYRSWFRPLHHSRRSAISRAVVPQLSNAASRWFLAEETASVSQSAVIQPLRGVCQITAFRPLRIATGSSSLSEARNSHRYGRSLPATYRKLVCWIAPNLSAGYRDCRLTL